MDNDHGCAYASVRFYFSNDLLNIDMKTRTSLIIIFTIGLVFSIGIAIVDGYWGFDSTVTISSAAFVCLVIMVVNKIRG